MSLSLEDKCPEKYQDQVRLIATHLINDEDDKILEMAMAKNFNTAWMSAKKAAKKTAGFHFY